MILDDHIYVSTHSKGVLQSNDGNSWAQINDGLGITVHDMLLHNDLLTVMEVFRLSRHGTMLVATTRKGLFRRTGNEDSWTLTNPVVVKHSGRVESENNSQDKPGLNPSPEQHSSSDLRVESFASMKHLLLSLIHISEPTRPY